MVRGCLTHYDCTQVGDESDAEEPGEGEDAEGEAAEPEGEEGQSHTLTRLNPARFELDERLFVRFDCVFAYDMSPCILRCILTRYTGFPVILKE